VACAGVTDGFSSVGVMVVVEFELRPVVPCRRVSYMYLHKRG